MSRLFVLGFLLVASQGTAVAESTLVMRAEEHSELQCEDVSLTFRNCLLQPLTPVKKEFNIRITGDQLHVSSKSTNFIPREFRCHIGRLGVISDYNRSDPRIIKSDFSCGAVPDGNGVRLVLKGMFVKDDNAEPASSFELAMVFDEKSQACLLAARFATLRGTTEQYSYKSTCEWAGTKTFGTPGSGKIEVPVMGMAFD